MYVDEVLVDVCATAAATPTPIPTPIPGPTATPNPALCAEKLGNTGFEDNTAWQIPVTAFSAGYSTDLAHSGLRSMRSGITAKAHNRFSYSDFRQVVSLPRNLSSATLTMWLSAATGEATALSTPERPTASLKAEAASAGDVQYVLILDAFGNWIDTLVWQRQNVPTWTAKTFDMSAYAGETIQLQFGVYNDGLDGVTAMYVDDVSFQVCP
jgi:hypothetical protein